MSRRRLRPHHPQPSRVRFLGPPDADRVGSKADRARAWAVLVRRLGYENWFAQGGDVGAFVTADLAAIEAREGIGLRGIHLNETPFAPTEDEIRDADAQERQMLREGEQYGDRLSGYFHEMTTRPQTIGFSLSDSPVGPASWIDTMFQDMAGRTVSTGISRSSSFSTNSSTTSCSIGFPTPVRRRPGCTGRRPPAAPRTRGRWRTR